MHKYAKNCQVNQIGNSESKTLQLETAQRGPGLDKVRSGAVRGAAQDPGPWPEREASVGLEQELRFCLQLTRSPPVEPQSVLLPTVCRVASKGQEWMQELPPGAG